MLLKFSICKATSYSTFLKVNKSIFINLHYTVIWMNQYHHAMWCGDLPTMLWFWKELIYFISEYSKLSKISHCYSCIFKLQNVFGAVFEHSHMSILLQYILRAYPPQEWGTAKLGFLLLFRGAVAFLELSIWNDTTDPHSKLSMSPERKKNMLKGKCHLPTNHQFPVNLLVFRASHTPVRAP